MATVKRIMFRSLQAIMIIAFGVSLVFLIKGCSERIDWNLAD